MVTKSADERVEDACEYFERVKEIAAVLSLVSWNLDDELEDIEKASKVIGRPIQPYPGGKDAEHRARVIRLAIGQLEDLASKMDQDINGNHYARQQALRDAS